MKKTNFTLVELLIVLVILAGLLTVATVSVENLQTKHYADKTESRGKTVEEAVNGKDGGVSRFVADMGRLPIVLNNVHSLNLAELFYTVDQIPDDVKWNNDEEFDSSTNPFDESWANPANVILPCGWRGPYLNTRAKDGFYDGFGNEWEVTHSPWTTIPKVWGYGTIGPNIYIYGIRSLGRNNSEGGAEWFDKDRPFSFNENAVTANLTVKIMGRDSSVSPTLFRRIEDATPYSYWEANTAYVVGDVVYSTLSPNCFFECTQAGTSAGTEPAPWDTTVGNETTDNVVTWECVSLSNSYDLDTVKVALYVPYVTQSSCVVKRILAASDDADDDPEWFPAGSGNGEKATWTDDYNVSITNLSPGPRKLYVYGFRENAAGEADDTHCYHSGILSIELKPGGNSLTVYLTKPLP